MGDYHILLVDDNEDDRYCFQLAIGELGEMYRLDCCSNSELIQQYINKSKPDLIFMDINMPNKTGIECLGELKQHKEYSQIPVIMYSVSSNEQDQKASFNAGAHYYFIKPYAEKVLVTTLKKIFQTDWKVVQAIPQWNEFVIDLDFSVI